MPTAPKFDPSLPRIQYAAILVPEGPLVEAGLLIRREVLDAITQSIQFSTDATRLFKSSPHIGNQTMVIIIRHGKAYLATASPELPLRSTLAYLVEMAQAFQLNPKLNPSGETAAAKSKESYKAMKKLMEERMEFYSYSPDADKFRAIFKDVDETKLALHDCIEKLLQRQQSIELLEEKSALLSEKASRLERLSKELSWKEYWKTKKCQIIGASTAVLATATVITGVCAALI